MTCRLAVALFLFTLPAALTGCGKPAEVAPPITDQVVMTEIYSMYKGYTTDHKKAPQKLSDFDHPYEPAAVYGYAALRDGKAVMFWGGSLPGPAAGTTILAHLKDVPTQGGLVVFQDGTVKAVTADEFKAAPKVGQK